MKRSKRLAMVAVLCGTLLTASCLLLPRYPGFSACVDDRLDAMLQDSRYVQIFRLCPKPAFRTVSTVRVPAPPNPWSDLARDILAQYCGQCHRSDLRTALPGALAVFDLLDEPWYGKIRPEQFDGLLVRLRAVKDFAPEDAHAMANFIRCARDGECNPDPVDAP